MKHWSTIFMALAMVFCLTCSCLAQTEKDNMLCADFTCGSVEEDVRTTPFIYTGELTAEKISRGLTLWTGLDFKINGASKTEDGILVDWSKQSTLIAGLDDREQKKEFHFFDVESLDWFMLDSMWRTLTQNLGVENVYYSMDGGKDLELPGLSTQSVFPKDLPYMGSPFFYAHAGGRGEGDGEVGELGYDDEEGYDDPYDALVETTLLSGQNMELIQHTSDGQAIREGTAMDGQVLITNCALAPIEDPNNLEEIVRDYAAMITAGQLISASDSSGADIAFLKFRLFEDPEYSAKTSHPCYLASWTSDDNEDTRENLALVMLTDTSTQMYRFAVPVDAFEDVRDQLYQVLDGLNLQQTHE